MKNQIFFICLFFSILSINAQSVRFSNDSTFFLPDGPLCFPGIFTSAIYITSFDSTDSIHNLNDVVSICANLEHSYAGDLGITVYCPNGQFAVIDPNTHSGGNYLGVPMGGTNHHSFDNACLPVDNPPGTGWNYCWSEIHTNNYSLTFDQLSSSASTGTTLVGGGRTIDSTYLIKDSNYIKPIESFSKFIGCPINGCWKIEIKDDFGSDNGYIFGWSLSFSSQYATPNTPTATLTGDSIYSDAAFGNQWYNLSTGLIPGATSYVYQPIQSGYYFTIVTLNGYSSDSSNLVYYQYTGINDNLSNKNNLKVYPNPFSKETNFTYTLNKKETVELKILEITGKEIINIVEKEQSIGSHTIVLQSDKLNKGIYFYNLIIGNKHKIGKLIKY